MREILRALRVTLILWLITAVIYPFSIIAFGQSVFPFQANGSILTNSKGTPVGSALIGQSFTSTRYFWGRPSSINYSQKSEVAATGISGGSNLAPSNPELLKRVKATNQALINGKVERPIADLLYASGSGLDPHISLEAAYAQASRIAANRNLFVPKLYALIDRNIDRRFLWIFGAPGVNVLKLNLELDKISAAEGQNK